MEIEDTAYVLQEVKRIDLKMYIKKYSDSIAIEVKDEESGKIIYFSMYIFKSILFTSCGIYAVSSISIKQILHP